MVGPRTHAERPPAPEPRRDRGETAASRRWDALTYWPLTAAALVFLLSFTAQVIVPVGDAISVALTVVILVVWWMFLVDYVVKVVLVRPRWLWMRSHLFDAAVVLIPLLRPLRLLTALARVRPLNGTAGDSLRARMLIYGIGAAILLVWTAALSVLQAERSAPDANIRSFGDAIWWAFCTVTTVGYGDYTPVTALGRTIAVGLMLGGVVLVGLVTATFASWVVERATRGHEDQQPATRADVHKVVDELRGIEDEAQARRDASPSP